jgi:hypothetical protein
MKKLKQIKKLLQNFTIEIGDLDKWLMDSFRRWVFGYSNANCSNNDIALFTITNFG